MYQCVESSKISGTTLNYIAHSHDIITLQHDNSENYFWFDWFCNTRATRSIGNINGNTKNQMNTPKTFLLAYMYSI